MTGQPAFAADLQWPAQIWVFRAAGAGRATPERLLEVEPALTTKWTPLQSHYYDNHACDG